MALFDDPRKELQRLQEELLAAERPEPEEEEFDDLDLAELKRLLNPDAKEDYENCFQENYENEYNREPFYRNHANGYGSQVRNYANNYGRSAHWQAASHEEEDEELSDSDVYYREDYRQDRRQAKKEQRRERRKNGNTGLVVLAILETLGILAIAGWWVLWLL